MCDGRSFPAGQAGSAEKSSTRLGRRRRRLRAVVVIGRPESTALCYNKFWRRSTKLVLLRLLLRSAPCRQQQQQQRREKCPTDRPTNRPTDHLTDPDKETGSTDRPSERLPRRAAPRRVWLRLGLCREHVRNRAGQCWRERSAAVAAACFGADTVHRRQNGLN